MILGFFRGYTVKQVKTAAVKVKTIRQEVGARVAEALLKVDQLRAAGDKQVAAQAATFEQAKKAALADRYAALREIQTDIAQINGLAIE